MPEIVVWEMVEARPTSNAVRRWERNLAAERDTIVIKLAKAFGCEDCNDFNSALEYIKTVPQEKFVEVLAKRAYAGWTKFFDVQPGDTPLGRAALKLMVKLARKHRVWGENTANAFANYFTDRVAAKVDNYRENVVYTIRLVGDPPEVPLGPAPALALALTGVEPVPVPGYYSVEAVDYFEPAIAPFVRPAIVATVVQLGVMARYAKDAGLDTVAQQFLDSLAMALKKLSALRKPDYQELAVEAAFASHPQTGEPAIRIKATVQRAPAT